STPASCRAPMSPASTYLVAARIWTSGPTCSRTRARFSLTTDASSTAPHHPLAAGHAVVAAVREVAIRVADRALPRLCDLGDAAGLEGPPGTQPEVSPVALDDVRAEPGREHLGDLGA